MVTKKQIARHKKAWIKAIKNGDIIINKNYYEAVTYRGKGLFMTHQKYKPYMRKH